MKYNIEYSNYVNKESLLFGVPWIGIFYVLIFFGIGIILIEFTKAITDSEIVKYLQIILLALSAILFYVLKFLPEKFFNILYIQDLYLKNKRNRKIKTPRL
jgi:hypothetical protein